MELLKIFLWLMSYFVLRGKAQAPITSCTDADGRQGSCVSILKCPAMKQLLVQITLGNEQFSKMRRNICHLGDQPYLCCAHESSSHTLPSPPSPNPFPTGIGEAIVQPNILPSGADLLPVKCGIRGLTDRIIAGQPAPLGAWPWIVALNGKFGNRNSWHCGGTLISNRYVITAAHCIDSRFGVQLDFVRIGEHTIGTSPDCTPFGSCAPEPQDIRVERVIMHPSYNSPCKDCNDIALLRLERPATMHRRYVQPICLPLNPVEDMGFPIEELQGKAAWAAGWGTISQDPRLVVRPEVLQQVQLPIQRLAICDVFSEAYPDPKMILCAGGDGRDTCRGDSGGPLVLTNSFGTRYFLVGLTSKGPSVCGTKDTQGIYTSIHYYLPWILSNLEP